MDITKKDYDLLVKMAGYESTMSEDERPIGWTWAQVAVYPSTIHRFLVGGLVKMTYKSRSSTNYMLTDIGKAVVDAGESALKGASALGMEATFVEGVAEEVVVPNIESMFSDITGYDDIKELLRESLQLDKAIHVLLHGPPSLAKSMFLWDIERAYGDQAVPLLGSATSHAGLWDLIAEKKPRVILVDEIEKMNLTDMAGLLSIMQTGRIIRAKVGRRLDVKLNVWVIGAANKIYKMPPELLSRFAVCQLTQYTAAEFRSVVASVLFTHEDTSADDAGEIALRLVGRTHDVRDAIRVARLAKRVGVKRAVELLLR